MIQSTIGTRWGPGAKALLRSWKKTLLMHPVAMTDAVQKGFRTVHCGLTVRMFSRFRASQGGTRLL